MWGDILMKILIVEDDQKKLFQLRNYIEEKYAEADIVTKRAYNSGLRELIEHVYDLLLLDMTLPTFEVSPSEPGGRPRPFGGREILIEMARHKIDVPVIIVTQFETFGEGDLQISLDELRHELFELKDPRYKGTIYYNSMDNRWKKELQKAITSFVKLNAKKDS